MFLLVFAESIQLFPDGTLFIHIALILLMIWILNRTFFRPINRIIESREQHKGGHGSEAEAILSDVGEKQAKYNQTLLEARSASYELIEKERLAALTARQSTVSKAKQETSAVLVSEKQQIADNAAEARATIAKEADAMAEKITSNILKA
jgi:F0F1-type ATP synthase membrane subunit b/b'